VLGFSLVDLVRFAPHDLFHAMEDKAFRLQVILLILNHLRISTAPTNAGIVRDLARSAGIVRMDAALQLFEFWQR